MPPTVPINHYSGSANKIKINWFIDLLIDFFLNVCVCVSVLFKKKYKFKFIIIIIIIAQSPIPLSHANVFKIRFGFDGLTHRKETPALNTLICSR